MLAGAADRVAVRRALDDERTVRVRDELVEADGRGERRPPGPAPVRGGTAGELVGGLGRRVGEVARVCGGDERRNPDVLLAHAVGRAPGVVDDRVAERHAAVVDLRAGDDDPADRVAEHDVRRPVRGGRDRRWRRTTAARTADHASRRRSCARRGWPRPTPPRHGRRTASTGPRARPGRRRAGEAPISSASMCGHAVRDRDLEERSSGRRSCGSRSAPRRVVRRREVARRAAGRAADELRRARGSAARPGRRSGRARPAACAGRARTCSQSSYMLSKTIRACGPREPRRTVASARVRLGRSMPAADWRGSAALDTVEVARAERVERVPRGAACRTRRRVALPATLDSLAARGCGLGCRTSRPVCDAPPDLRRPRRADSASSGRAAARAPPLVAVLARRFFAACRPNDVSRRRSARGYPALDQLDPVAVGIADEADPRAALAHRVRRLLGLDALARPGARACRRGRRR